MSHQVIKEARKKKDLTQEDLAKDLGVSRNIIMAIEKGERELTMGEAKKLSDLLGITVESLADDHLSDFSKYKEMILYTLETADEESIPKTKLAKLLYLTDFTWHYHHLESMSGMSYRKYPYGPVPNEYFRALEELELEYLINVETDKTDDGYTTYLISLTEGGKKATKDKLETAEKELINDITAKWQSKRTRDIVGFTHQQLPYKLSADDEIISYALITQEDEGDLY